MEQWGHNFKLFSLKKFIGDKRVINNLAGVAKVCMVLKSSCALSSMVHVSATEKVQSRIAKLAADFPIENVKSLI